MKQSNFLCGLAQRDASALVPPPVVGISAQLGQPSARKNVLAVTHGCCSKPKRSAGGRLLLVLGACVGCLATLLVPTPGDSLLRPALWLLVLQAAMRGLHGTMLACLRPR